MDRTRQSAQESNPWVPWAGRMEVGWKDEQPPEARGHQGDGKARGGGGRKQETSLCRSGPPGSGSSLPSLGMERRARGASSSSLGLRGGAAAGWHVSSLSPAGSAHLPREGQFPPNVPWVGDPLPASLKADPLETTRSQTHFLSREPRTEIQGVESVAPWSEDHG